MILVAAPAAPVALKSEPIDHEAASRQPINFNVTEKPEGTAGRGGANGYNLQDALEIDDATYRLMKVSISFALSISMGLNMVIAYY
jgi:hypothetical protein